MKAFFRAMSDSWADPSNNHNDALEWLVAHDYPGLVSREQCRSWLGDRLTTPGYEEEYVLEENSIERDDGWTMTFPPLKGQVPDGRIYIVKVLTSAVGYGPVQTATNQVHITFIDNRPYNFVVCQ